MKQEDLNKLRWRVISCGEKDCWCRCIGTETPVFDDNGDELYIAPAGSIPKENAEHIVEVHNECLEKIDADHRNLS